MATKLPIFPTIGKSFKESFMELYSSLGFTMLVSFIWFISYLPVLLLVGTFLLRKVQKLPEPAEIMSLIIAFVVLFGFWNTLVGGPLFSAAYGLYQGRKEDYPSFKMFFRIFRENYRRSAAVWGTFSVGLGLLLLNMVIALLGKQLLLFIAGAVSLYVVFFILLMSFYFNPLINLGNSFKKVIRKSFLLVLDNFGLSIWFLLILGGLLVLSIYVPFLFVLIYGAMVIYFTDKGFFAVYDKYDS